MNRPRETPERGAAERIEGDVPVKNLLNVLSSALGSDGDSTVTGSTRKSARRRSGFSRRTPLLERTGQQPSPKSTHGNEYSFEQTISPRDGRFMFSSPTDYAGRDQLSVVGEMAQPSSGGQEPTIPTIQEEPVLTLGELQRDGAESHGQESGSDVSASTSAHHTPPFASSSRVRFSHENTPSFSGVSRRRERPLPEQSAFETSLQSSFHATGSPMRPTAPACPPTPARTPAWATGIATPALRRANSLSETRTLLAADLDESPIGIRDDDDEEEDDEEEAGRRPNVASRVKDDSDNDDGGDPSSARKPRVGFLSFSNDTADSSPLSFRHGPSSTKSADGRMRKPSFGVASRPSTSSVGSGSAASSGAALHVESFERSFENLGQIGEGAFSIVYRARAKADGRMYAVKRTRHQFRSRRDRAAHLAEFRLAIRLKPHPGLVRYSVAWQEGGYLYFAMELCPKGSVGGLARRVASGDICLARDDSALVPPEARTDFMSSSDGEPALAARGDIGDDEHHSQRVSPFLQPAPATSHPLHVLPESIVWAYIAETANALAALHSQYILHMDVKPENSLIGEDGHIKLGDLGLARSFAAERQPSNPVTARVELPSNMSFSRASFSGAHSPSASRRSEDGVTGLSPVRPGLFPVDGSTSFGGPQSRSPDTRSPQANLDDFHDSSEGDSRYMAPELLRAGNIAPPADIFSLGVAAFELAWGLDAPEGGDGWHALRERRIPGLPAGVTRSRALVRLVLSLLDPEPETRPTAEQVRSHASVSYMLLQNVPMKALQALEDVQTRRPPMLVRAPSVDATGMAVMTPNWPLPTPPARGVPQWGEIGDENDEGTPLPPTAKKPQSPENYWRQDAMCDDDDKAGGLEVAEVVGYGAAEQGNESHRGPPAGVATKLFDQRPSAALSGAARSTPSANRPATEPTGLTPSKRLFSQPEAAGEPRLQRRRLEGEVSGDTQPSRTRLATRLFDSNAETQRQPAMTDLEDEDEAEQEIQLRRRPRRSEDDKEGGATTMGPVRTPRLARRPFTFDDPPSTIRTPWSARRHGEESRDVAIARHIRTPHSSSSSSSSFGRSPSPFVTSSRHGTVTSHPARFVRPASRLRVAPRTVARPTQASASSTTPFFRRGRATPDPAADGDGSLRRRKEKERLPGPTLPRIHHGRPSGRSQPQRRSRQSFQESPAARSTAPMLSRGYSDSSGDSPSAHSVPRSLGREFVALPSGPGKRQ